MFALQTRYVLRTRYVPLELDMFLRNKKRTDAEWHIRPILNVDISQQFMIFKNQFMLSKDNNSRTVRCNSFCPVSAHSTYRCAETGQSHSITIFSSLTVIV